MWRVTAYDREGRVVATFDAASGEVTVGREPDRQLVLSSPSVSRRHAKIVLDGPQPFIVDEGSANGVVLNGARITAPTAIAAGLRVDIAEFWLQLTDAAAADHGAPPPVAPPAYGAPPPAAPPYGAPPPAAPPPAYGAPPPAAPVYGAPLAYAPPATRPLRLRVESGPYGGRSFEVSSGVMSVGRAIDNDLVFDDPSLSRKHGRLTNAAGRVEVEDLGSSNGTWVNGRRIDRSPLQPGDVLRFGELQLLVEGEGGTPRQPPQARQTNTPFHTPLATPAAGSGSRTGLVLGVVGALALVLAAGGTWLFLRSHKTQAPAQDTIAHIAAEAAEHFKKGKEKLAAKDFTAAEAEFARTLELDPANVEASRLKQQAAAEPQYEKESRQLSAKLAMGSRADLEAATHLLAAIAEGSVYREPAATKLTTKLVSFGEDECKARHWNDCAWALCKANEVAPEAQRAALVPESAHKTLASAEHKLARDKTYTRCKTP